MLARTRWFQIGLTFRALIPLWRYIDLIGATPINLNPCLLPGKKFAHNFLDNWKIILHSQGFRFSSQNR